MITLNDKHLLIWDKVKPLLAKVKKKDYVLHVEMVTKAMSELIKKEGGDSAILIPAALLHDVGWSEVPDHLQLATKKEDKVNAGKQHIEKAPAIIRRILSELGYDPQAINEVIRVVLAHKYTQPDNKDEQLLIDADTLSDTYKKSFYSDINSYNTTPQDALKFRSQNTFYTQTAKQIFKREIDARRREIKTEQ